MGAEVTAEKGRRLIEDAHVASFLRYVDDAETEQAIVELPYSHARILADALRRPT